MSGLRRGRRAAGVRRPGHGARRPGRPGATPTRPPCWRPSAAPSGSVPAPRAELPADADLVITTGWPADRAAAGPGRRPRRADLERGGAGLAAQPAGQGRARGWASPAPTARPPPPRCWRRSCPRPGCGRPRSATSAGRSWRSCSTASSYDVLAVELSSHQLHWSHSLAAALGRRAQRAARPPGVARLATPPTPTPRPRIYAGVQASCVYNVADPETERMVEEAEVVEGARAIGFTLGTPGLSMLGVVDDLLVDRAFIQQRRDSALELAKVSDVPGAAGRPAAPHLVANALAAAALARSFGVPATAVRDGLRATALGAHKIQTVAELAGVRWVDDSKATNPHAADAALRAYEPPADPSPARSSGSPAARPRAPPSTTWSARTASGCAAPCCWASTGRSSPTRWPDTRRTSRSKRSRPRTLEPWRRPSRRPPRWPDPAMPCCWLRVAPARTCTPTTPRAGRPSPRPSGTRRRGRRPVTARTLTRTVTARPGAPGTTGRSGARHVPGLDRPAAASWRRLAARRPRPPADQLPPGARRGAAAAGASA